MPSIHSNYFRIILVPVRTFFSLHLLLASFIFYHSSITVSAQYLQNGAMESENTGSANPPDYWGVCDVFSTPELQDIFIRNADTAVSPDFSNFSILRVRGENNDPSGTVEHMFTRLITPLEKGYCYQFSGWLYHTYNGAYDHPTLPVKLQLWGGLDSCSMDEMLYESELITSGCCWQKYLFRFVVENNDYPYFYIRPYWDFVNVSDDYYDGIIMMDNLSIQQIKPMAALPVDTLYFWFGQPLQLRAGEGVSWAWIPPDVVSDPNDRDPLLLEYTERLDVIVQDQDYCPVRESYIILIECDSLYQSEILNLYDVYYSLQHPVELKATSGSSYDWEPKTGLSDYSIQNPVLTAYRESFRVAVEDEYGCKFFEQFNILAVCDTLYPQKSFYTLDTVIQQGAEVLLQPSFGSPADQWEPSFGLSCTTCLAPEANPTSSVLYSIKLTDIFDCIHEELFSVEVVFEIPNVITPNGDGYNDEFVIGGLPPGSSVQIYRHDGVLLYENTHYGHPEWWGGTDRSGNVISTGSYWYVLEIPTLGIVKKDFIFLKR